MTNGFDRKYRYALYDGVTVKELPKTYNVLTKITFIDPIYGEFVTTPRSMQNVKGSTHPKRVQERRLLSIKEKYGVANISLIPEVKKKKVETNLQRYGVTAPCKNPDIDKKRRESRIKE